MPESHPVGLERAAVDLARLADWMEEQGLGSGPLSDVALIDGGTQNILMRFRYGGHWFVLRRPPVHKRDNSDETMRREARVLKALAGTEVPHPRLIAGCPDTGVIGAAFYLMELVDGFNPAHSGLPEPHRSDRGMQRRMGLEMADGLAALASLDPVDLGVADLGRASGWLERQVGRWRAQLDSYSQLDGYPGPDIPGLDSVADWLAANRPTSWRAGVIHGDVHLGNVLFSRHTPKLAAIVDWELTTVGDPLLDLGHLLATWPGESSPGGPLVVDAPGLPRRRELIERYAARSRRDLSAIDWYEVLACYRLGIIMEGSHARAAAGLTSRRVGDRLHGVALWLFEQARRRIAHL